MVILIAITPIASASMLQGVLQLRRATEEAQHRLLQGAIAGAGSQQNVIASAENVLQALKNVQDVRNGGDECVATLYGATLSLPFASNIALLSADGIVLCSALSPVGTDVSQRPWWLAASKAKAFVLSGRIVSPITRGEVIAGTLPLFGTSGAFEGALSVAIDAGWLDNLLKREAPLTDGVAAVLTAGGAQLVSNAPAISARLFASQNLANYVGQLGETRDDAGRSWSFAVARLDRHELLVAFAQPTDQLFQWTAFHVAVSFILPIFMLAFTIVAIWLATDRMVLQWLLYLRRVTAVYAQGHYGFRPSRMDLAPSEFRVLGNAIEDMASAIRERDGKLREGLAEKTALVREIHHRIKNSLQVVVSLLSLYGSGVRGEEDRRRFDHLRMRVNTLAVVHRILYEANEGSEVRSRELLRELAALLEVAVDRNVLIVVDAEDLALPTDLAVPLALLLTEVVLILADGEAGSPTHMAIRGMEETGMLVLRIDISATLSEELGETRAPLAHGFARQLGGTITTTVTPSGSQVEVRFPPRVKRG
ncbi:sensor histidine kinase [Aquabacter spiritensis]|uniref:sensor histidine kinase n=1 Tax=Aquabacter spiritensis TaxID=933073 RepID=UPI0014046E08|nr:sensor histidine kinase [Aquabacter spiritensis]